MGQNPLQDAAILVVPGPARRREIFQPETMAALCGLGAVTLSPDDHGWSSEELAKRIGGHDVVITCWGTPVFTSDVLVAVDRLRLIAHSAGSVRSLVPKAVLRTGVQVTHCSHVFARGVAEFALALIMESLRHTGKRDRILKAGGDWEAAREPFFGEEIGGTCVGVVGAGYCGRVFIGLMLGLGADVLVFDPYLSDAEAACLGVRKADLDSLLGTVDIVSLMAPSTKETLRMIGPRELGLLRDGALVINTGRSWLVDMDALLAELRAGRIRAGLDVFDEEPIPEDSPFRALGDNVVLAPHHAGHSIEGRRRMGEGVVSEITRFLAGRSLQFEVTLDNYDLKA